MQGWMSSDLGNEEIQATPGDNTTGLIVSFGCTNAVNAVNPLYPTNNRALGMITSPATSGGGSAGNPSAGIFALRVLNTTGQTLTNINLSYTAELWRNTTVTNWMTNYYYIDNYATNGTPTNNWTGSLALLSFPTNTAAQGKTFGTNAPVATNQIQLNNLQLATGWTNGGLLWLVWEETTAVSGAQGLGIDNLYFSATGSGSPALAIQKSGSSVILSWPSQPAGYFLYFNTSGNIYGSWQPYTAITPVLNSVTGIYSVTIPIAAGQDVFFRLQ
jgi:hypothetical protein